MFIERRINPSSGTVELWRCQWENRVGGSARKLYLGKICDEQPISPEAEGALAERAAICWAYGRTLGNIAVISQSGAICTAILDWAEANDIGFSAVVSTGIAWLSGLWHQRQDKGHPRKKSVVLIPGPSWME